METVFLLSVNMETMKTNQNQYDTNVSKLAKLEQYKKLSNITAESYEERIGGVQTIVSVISYLCQFIDAFICGLGAFLLCYSTTMSLLLSVFFAISIALILELLKRYFLKLLFRHAIHGWLKARRYWVSFMFCLVFAVVGFVGSWHFSVDGSTEIVHWVRQNMQPPATVSDSAATHVIDVAIRQKQADMERIAHLANGNDWTVTNRTYPALLAGYDKLIAKRDTIIERNKQENTEKQQRYKQTSESVGWSVSFVSGGTLLILFLSVWFLEYYYRQVVSEKPEWMEAVFGNEKKQTEKGGETYEETETVEQKQDEKQQDDTEKQKQVVDISTLSKKARTYYKRSFTAKSQATRERNKAQAEQYISELEKIGCTVIRDGQTLRVKT